MGQAKRRGTYEQRVLAGEAKAELAAKERQRKLDEAEAALTPEQKEKRKRARQTLATVLGFAVANAGSSYVPNLRRR